MDVLKGAGRLLGQALKATFTAVFGKYLLIAAAIGGIIALVAMALVVPSISADQKRIQAGGEVCVPTGNTGIPPAAPGAFLQQQIANAKTIDGEAAKLGLSGKASRVAIITAYGESTLINIDHGDLAGPDSRGLFQQRPSQGWGTDEQVMDPAYAATSFLIGPKHDRSGGLVSIAGWESMEPTLAINKVQRNHDPNHYSAFYAAADDIIKRAGIDVGRAGSTGAADGPGSTDDAPSGSSCGGQPGKIGEPSDDYPFKSITPGPGIYVADPMGYFYGECTSFVAWRINRDAGSNGAPFKFSSAAGNFSNGNASDWKAAWESRGWKVSNVPVPGAVAWWGSFGGTGIGSAGHVAYVSEVTAEGKVIIEEYNNTYYAPPGHKYAKRPLPEDPANVGAFLYPPGK
ncbi:CHAP domain-containing protein [Paenarthrobacter ureafaciens]|uniref:CHAP domain-containing protein n=1 Tax=Paenarthrobacter ureafaciens TaxID=37931 RepID=UPI0034DACAD6